MTIAMYFDDLESLPEYGQAQLAFSGIRDIQYELNVLNSQLILVSSMATYSGEGNFTRHWQFGSDFGLVEGGHVKADLVFKQGEFRLDDVKTINHQELWAICNDKYLTQRMFPRYYPKTILVPDFSSLKHAISLIEGSTKVLKSTVGSYSQQVWIGDENYLLKQKLSYPLIAQEFIDSTYGIPGLTPGEHDLRVVMIESMPSLVLVRVPAPNEHRAGLRLGASFYFADLDQLPMSVKHMVSAIDDELKEYKGRVYSIDCALTASGPKIIELNKEPAIWPSSEHPHLDTFNKQLAKHIVRYSKFGSPH